MEPVIKYIYLLSPQLAGFKKTGDRVFNFRCPICGDSEKKKSKKRGYIFEKNGKYIFHCHNCLITNQFKEFLKKIDLQLYSEFLQESILSKGENFTLINKPLIVIKTDLLFRLPKISSLRPEHPAKKFIVSRQIPTFHHHKIFFCQKFKTFVNSIIPGKFTEIGQDEPRIIIPIYRDKRLIGFQGRAIRDNPVRYITIVLDETMKPMVYGYDDISWNSNFYVFEGIFDSLFIPNSIAVCGSSLLSAMNSLNKPKNYSVLCFDNEPRNKEIVSSMDRAINAGFRICIFPASVIGKDINEMINHLVLPSEFIQTGRVVLEGRRLKMLIDQNTYSGLSGELKLSEWRKS